MPHNSYIVRIAGGSASGKSTFALQLKAVLEAAERSVTPFAMDRYAVSDKAAGPQVTLPSGESHFDWNRPESFDAPRLLDDVRAAVSDVVIVEGHMVLAVEDTRRILDLRVFIELDADERALRRMRRDMAGGRANMDPEFIHQYYRASARVGHHRHVEPSRVHADIILRGDGDFERTSAMIAAIVLTANSRSSLWHPAAAKR